MDKWQKLLALESESMWNKTTKPTKFILSHIINISLDGDGNMQLKAARTEDSGCRSSEGNQQC
jgi:hypothetical protein